jgi:hypothetical protein
VTAGASRRNRQFTPDQVRRSAVPCVRIPQPFMKLRLPAQSLHLRGRYEAFATEKGNNVAVARMGARLIESWHTNRLNVDRIKSILPTFVLRAAPFLGDVRSRVSESEFS